MTGVMKPGRHRVLVAGGGVAALESLLALRHLAGHRVETTLLAPGQDFAPRAGSVAAPFGLGGSPSIPLAALEQRLGVAIRRGKLTGVKPEGRVALVDDRGALSYDTLVVTVGARAVAAVPGALTFTGPDAVPGLERMLDAAEGGELRRLVFAVRTAPAGRFRPMSSRSWRRSSCAIAARRRRGSRSSHRSTRR
jgi:sulfide:quinone oxidoreductase